MFHYIYSDPGFLPPGLNQMAVLVRVYTNIDCTGDFEEFVDTNPATYDPELLDWYAIFTSNPVPSFGGMVVE
jgi:hypothetical protein